MVCNKGEKRDTKEQIRQGLIKQLEEVMDKKEDLKKHRISEAIAAGDTD